MKTHSNVLLLTFVALALATPQLPADVYSGTISTNWSGSQAVPDNNAGGVAFSFNISTPVFASITNLTVDLKISGGWNGDLYAYLSHGSGFSVLLNRVGRTASNPFGSGVSGMDIEFSDSYLTDIHTFNGNPLTGNFAPDARHNLDPFNTLDTDPRNAPLGTFTGLDPNGSWTLFFADLAPAGISTVQSWTVNLGVTTIPEPASTVLVALAALLAFARRTLTATRRL